MNRNNISIKNIYIKNTKIYNNKNPKNSYKKNNETKEDNLTEKNNVIFIKNNTNLLEKTYSKEKFRSINKSKLTKEYQNKNDDTYFNKNDKKKMIKENVNLLIDNIRDDNIMTIHNINLINSMNNITFYDSIPNMKKKLIKYPISKFNSQTFNKNKNIKNINSSMDINYNTKKQKNNIIVNKNKILRENKNRVNNFIGYNSINNKYKNNSLSKKKNPFTELNYKKLNCSGTYNFSAAKFNKENNYSNLYKPENKNKKNLYSNLEYVSTREICFRDLSHSKKKNINNSINKRLSNENTLIKNDLSNYNTFSIYTSSLGEEESLGNKNRNICDKINNRNIINVNKLESFKLNGINKTNNNNNFNNNNSIKNNNDNNSNVKISSNSSSNIFSLLSNKNSDNNKSKLDKENLNKIKKNIIDEKLYKTKSKDSFNIINNKEKMENNIITRPSKKTKSVEKQNNKNKINKCNRNAENIELTKKIKISSCFLNENYKLNYNNYKKNGIGNIHPNDSYKCGNNTSTSNQCSKLFYSTFNFDNKIKNINHPKKKEKHVYPNRINNHKNMNNNKEIPEFYRMSLINNNNIFEKIEVNKLNIPKVSLSKINESLNLKSSIRKQETRNESAKIYEKKTKRESWINNPELINSFSKNIDYYCYLSNYKIKNDDKILKNLENFENIRKRSAPKKSIPNLIYNKKQLSIQTKNEKQSVESTILSPNCKRRISDLSQDKNNFVYEITNISKIKNENYETEEESNNNNSNTDYINDKNINSKKNITNKTYLKSPNSRIYKKPGINFINNSNSLISNGKDSFNNKLFLCSNKIIENENENYLQNSNKKNCKIYLNCKSNKLISSKEISNGSNNNKFKNRIKINLNNINYDEQDLLTKTKDNILIESIDSYDPIKNNESKNDNNISNDYIINNKQFYVTRVNQKVPSTNSFNNKYYCFYINYKPKNNCFVSKIRIDKSNLIFYEIPAKKICYFSKQRKIMAKILPKSKICYFKKDLIINNNIKKIIKTNNNFIDDENLIINNEFEINKKENDDNNKNQYSFASINSDDIGNNYFEISFGKKGTKPLINLNSEINRNNLYNNNDNNVKKYFQQETIEEKNKIKKINYKDDNKFLFNNNEISSKKNLRNKNSPRNNDNNNIYLKKTEKGLKLIEKIAGSRISLISNIKRNYFSSNINKNDDIVINNRNAYKSNNNANNKSNCIKNDFIELLNILTFNNYDFILNKISYLILNNNMIIIDNISQLLSNQNEFIEIILNKAMTEKIYLNIYSKLCKDLFISLMSIIDNYNDDMDIFDKITKDKSLKVILKNKILEKINQFNFSPKKAANNLEKDFLYLEIKMKFTNLINFIAELLKIKLMSQKSGFEILEILYKKYIQGFSNNRRNIINYNDLYLEGIEILLSKMKKIIYDKNNFEHIQRYNKFIKNYLNNIFKNRIKRNDLQKYLYYKIYNLIESQKNEDEIKKKEKVKKFESFKGDIHKKKIIENNKDEYSTKNNKENNDNFNNKNNSFDYINISNDLTKNKSDLCMIKEITEGNNMIEIIKKDIEKLILAPNINQIKGDLFKEINKIYNEKWNIKKNIEIWEIFYYYIEACIDLIQEEEKVYIVNEYIENIINTFAIDLPNESWEMLHYRLITLYLNINEIVADNRYMHQIMGFLLYLLINNKLFFIKDLNNFLNKDNEIIINISKVVKFTIIFADKDAKKFHNDFKQTKLFIGNENFFNIVTKPLAKKYL